MLNKESAERFEGILFDFCVSRCWDLSLEFVCVKEGWRLICMGIGIDLVVYENRGSGWMGAPSRDGERGWATREGNWQHVS